MPSTGRLNNLVTSDLKNITSGRDFLFVGLNAPLNFALGMAFLYAILGWSSFVGMAVMVVLIPVPAWAATMMQSLQKAKMQAVCNRRVYLKNECSHMSRLMPVSSLSRKRCPFCAWSSYLDGSQGLRTSVSYIGSEYLAADADSLCQSTRNAVPNSRSCGRRSSLNSSIPL